MALALGTQIHSAICRALIIFAAIFFVGAAAANCQSCMSSSGSWSNTALAQTQTGSFRLTFDATPSAANIEAVGGLTSTAANEYTDLGASVRFSAGGVILVRNGSVFTAFANVPYAAGVTYHFILDVNISSHTYNAYVVIGSVQKTLGATLAFRTEQAAVKSFRYVGLLSSVGTLRICNIALGTTGSSTTTGQSCISSSGSWANTALSAQQSGSFRLTYDATPSAAPIESVGGLSSGAANDYTNLAASTRFNINGYLNVRNGPAFTAASNIRYSAGVTYHFILDVNISSHTYNAYVVIGSTQTTLGTNLAFRSEQAAVKSLNNVGVLSSTGGLKICNVTLSSAATGSSGATSLLNASVSSLNFGSIGVSSSSAQNVTLTNAGSSTITISKVSVSGAGFTAGGGAAGLILSSGQTATVAATFAPSSTGTFAGTLTFSSNATNSPATISLSGVGVKASAHSVTLSWNSSGSGIAGYYVYAASVSGGPYSRLNTSPVTGTGYVDSNVQSGDSYYFVVTSVNSANQESAHSAEVKAVVP